jgi:hypothetical protein
MATYVGKNGAVYVGANAVAEIKDWSLETTSEVVADTVMGDSWVTNKPTLKSWTSSFNAIWDDADTTGQLALDEGAEITLNLYPIGNTTGNKYWSGDFCQQDCCGRRLNRSLILCNWKWRTNRS